jgi:hypothetical protein
MGREARLNRARREARASVGGEAPAILHWLSFASGVILVDGCTSADQAFEQVKLMDVGAPEGDVKILGIPLASIPEDQRAAIAGLPRLTLLSAADLIQAGVQI